MSAEPSAPEPCPVNGSTSKTSTTRVVVAVVLQWRGKIAMMKRSQQLHHDGGKWHCITGYLEDGSTSRDQALEELSQETGLGLESLSELRAGPRLMINDERGYPWLVHTFAATTTQRRLSIDWEHDAYRWIKPEKVKRFSNRVVWLDAVLRAVHCEGDTEPGTSDSSSTILGVSWESDPL